MRTNPHLFVLGILALFALVGISGWSYSKTTPQFSLYKMIRAVKSHDYETFTKYFDVDSVVDNVIAKALESTRSKGVEESEGSEWEELGKDFAEGLITMMKPALKERFKEEIKRGVETGGFREDLQTVGLIGIFTRTTVQREGKVAKVALRKKDDEQLSMMMRNKDGYWQVFDFDMDFDFSDSEEKEEKETKREASFGDRADIGKGWFLTVNEPSSYEPTNRYDQPEEGYKYIAVEVIYENTSNETDRFSLSNLRLKDSQDHSYSHNYSGKEPELESGDLETEGRVRGFVTFEILENASVKSVVYSGSDATVVFE